MSPILLGWTHTGGRSMPTCSTSTIRSKATGRRISGPGRPATNKERMTTMAIRLNHTIVAAHDKETSAMFLAPSWVSRLPRCSARLRWCGWAIPRWIIWMSRNIWVRTARSRPALRLPGERERIRRDFARIRERRLPYWADSGATSATRSTPGTMGAGSTSTTRTATCWRLSPVRTAAGERRRPTRTPWWRRHWSPQITRTAALISKGRVAGTGAPVRSDSMGGPSSTQMEQGASMVLHDRYHCAAAEQQNPGALAPSSAARARGPRSPSGGLGRRGGAGGEKGLYFSYPSSPAMSRMTLAPPASFRCRNLSPRGVWYP